MSELPPVCFYYDVFRTFVKHVITEEDRAELLETCGDQRGTEVTKTLPLPFTVLVEKSTRTVLGVFRPMER